MERELSALPPDEQEKLRQTSITVLRYMAPMLCGWKERAELCRRYTLANPDMGLR